MYGGILPLSRRNQKDVRLNSTKRKYLLSVRSTREKIFVSGQQVGDASHLEGGEESVAIEESGQKTPSLALEGSERLPFHEAQP